MSWNRIKSYPNNSLLFGLCVLRKRGRSWLKRQRKFLAWWQWHSSHLKLIYFIPSLRDPNPSYGPITPSSSNPSSLLSFCSPSYLFSVNTNSQRPDCAYNPPRLDKPLISSLSLPPEDPGFEFLFLTSLWGPGFFPVEEPDPKLSSGDPSERAAQSWHDQKQRHWAQGIESSVHVQTGEEGWDLPDFHVCFSFSPFLIVGDCYCIHVQLDVLLHTNVSKLSVALYFSFADVPWQRCDVLTTRC